VGMVGGVVGGVGGVVGGIGIGDKGAILSVLGMSDNQTEVVGRRSPQTYRWGVPCPGGYTVAAAPVRGPTRRAGGPASGSPARPARRC
jgi:hypothetical protein